MRDIPGIFGSMDAPEVPLIGLDKDQTLKKNKFYANLK